MKYGTKATLLFLYVHPRLCFFRHLYTDPKFCSMNTKVFNGLFLLDFYWQNKHLETEIIVALYPFER